MQVLPERGSVLARNRFYEGGLPGALPSHDGDGGDIKIYVGASIA